MHYSPTATSSEHSIYGMGGITANTAPVPRINYKQCANNTNSNWWADPIMLSIPHEKPPSRTDRCWLALRRNVFHCIGLCGTLFFNGYDGSLFNGLQTINSWQTFFSHPKGNTLDLMNSAALFPGLVSPYFAEVIASRWGRRYAVWVGIFINVVGAVVNSAAINLGMYIAGRVFMGIGISMGLTIASTLLQEFAHPRFRAQIGSMYTTIYYIAAVISASICLGIRHLSGTKAWRIPCYLQLVGPTVTFLMTMTMPESPPRWLAKQGKSDEALQVLTEYHTNGGEPDELVRLEYKEIPESLRAEEKNSQTRYVDYLRPINRHRLFILISIAIGTNWSIKEQAELNLGLQIWNLILSTMAALSVDRVGRRLLWLASTIGMLVAFTIMMGLSGAYAHEGTKSLGIAVIPFLFIFFGFYTIA
ncbi:uncharacterized protein PV07_12504 [Cladophialophora immunda]|uniref:Major facilitator superfamily (MFS) profile domain-containing protein n=1 Tax=Cladophialophora immunda TaxID=569365 RepID=A0A0D2ABF3_9EURO|nr:uncharacterized protein PV07_12504 [Cladophialophora immunda]KIW22087.1 hypothetical protein PV07_12504 [Cladophialophora immunda]